MHHVVILAAGKGTRMKSDISKVLTPVRGTPIIHRLLQSIIPISATPTLIVGYKAEDVMRETGNKYNYVLQTEQLGTGHAIMSAKESLKDKGYTTILVFPGDHPLVKTSTIEKLIALHNETGAAVTLGTYKADSFDGLNSVFNNFGRIIRDEEGFVDRIVEYKDASEEERAVTEVNLSYYCFDAEWLWQNIDSLKDNNASKEYYLTDMIALAREQGKKVAAYIIQDPAECLGINTPEQLKIVEDAIGE